MVTILFLSLAILTPILVLFVLVAKAKKAMGPNKQVEKVAAIYTAFYVITIGSALYISVYAAYRLVTGVEMPGEAFGDFGVLLLITMLFHFIYLYFDMRDAHKSLKLGETIPQPPPR